MVTMGLPGEGEGVPGLQQPEGGLLSLLGDVLFAGAILGMMYPSLRRTIDRIDQHFCRQFWHITEVLMALAALTFVFMLMIAQQTRLTYCSLIRPIVEHQPNGDKYSAILLKVVVGALMVLNYFCASWLQRLVSMFFPSSRNPRWETRVPPGAGWNRPTAFDRSACTCRHARTFDTPQETLSNVNTNSQTPVPPTDTYSDIFSTVSSLVLNSDSCENQCHLIHKQPLYCDVGTMVRFPEYQRSLCPLQFCQGQTAQVFHSSRTGSGRKSSSHKLLSRSPSSPLLESPMASSTGFCTLAQSSFHQSNPDRAGRSHHRLVTGWVPISPADNTGNCEGQSATVLVPRVRKSRPSLAGTQTASGSNLLSICNPGQFQSSHKQQSDDQESDCSEMLQLERFSHHPSLLRSEGGSGRQQRSLACTDSNRRSSSAASLAGSVLCKTGDNSEDHASLNQVKNRRKRNQELLTMYKMTRSGKIYGYG